MERNTKVSASPVFQWRVLCFTGLSFLGALLLFWVQPLLSKAILPWFGGAPAVWTTCMLVFQTLLLIGYAYAHWLSQLSSRVLKLAIHLSVISVSIALLPVLPSDDWKPDINDDPSLQVILTLLACVGAPFFVLASTSPLTQHLYAAQFPGRSPYRLYSLSNAGSLLALISYPFLFEPLFELSSQSRAWTYLFLCFAALYSVTVWICWSRTSGAGLAQSAEVSRISMLQERGAPASPTLAEVLYWFALAATPSAMLLATTNQVCLDVASVPFLWVAPLSLYLLTFILCFDSSGWRQRVFYSWIFVAFAAATAAVLSGGERIAATVQVLVLFGTLFVGAMFCHGELASRRPDPRFLTLFYLVISGAGAAGGIFVAILAPRLFSSYIELPITVAATLALACLASRPALSPSLLRRNQSDSRVSSAFNRLGIATVFVGAGLGYAAFSDRTDCLHRERNFFGVLRVIEEHPEISQSAIRGLVHGRITHGAQYLSEERRRQPTTYYTPRSGIGIALTHHKADQPRMVGVVGLGAGTLAVYGKPGDLFRFYEIDPAVERLARTYFTYLKDSRAKIEVNLGDARLVMESQTQSERERKFDILVIDAFSSDSIPTHLLTREAMQLYLDRLDSNGILAIHVSNRHLDLARVVGQHVQSFSLESRLLVDPGNGVGAISSSWALLSRSAGIFQSQSYLGLSPISLINPVDWTDRHCSLFGVIKPFDINQIVTPGTDACTERLGKGVALLQAGMLRQAEAELRAAAAADPSRFEPWLHLGNTLRNLGDTSGAISSFETALRLAPNSSESANNLGMMLTRSDPQRAYGLYQTALTHDPRNASAHNNLGNLLARKGDLKQAIIHYEQALAIDPTLEAARKNLVVLRSALTGAQSGVPGG